jgi:hypothetical protein
MRRSLSVNLQQQHRVIPRIKGSQSPLKAAMQLQLLLLRLLMLLLLVVVVVRLLLLLMIMMMILIMFICMFMNPPDLVLHI